MYNIEDYCMYVPACGVFTIYMTVPMVEVFYEPCIRHSVVHYIFVMDSSCLIKQMIHDVHYVIVAHEVLVRNFPSFKKREAFLLNQPFLFDFF